MVVPKETSTLIKGVVINYIIYKAILLPIPVGGRGEKKSLTYSTHPIPIGNGGQYYIICELYQAYYIL